jgi:hypothetical protein
VTSELSIGAHKAVQIDVNDGDGGGHRELAVSAGSNLIVIRSYDAFVGEPEALSLMFASFQLEK